MERRDRAPVASFFSQEPLSRGATVALGEDAAHHARVRRLEVGECLRLLDGAGTTGTGTLLRVARSQLSVEVGDVTTVEPPPPVHLLVPIADRDRMLWLAEKSVELGVTSWRPVLWRRSKSVSPRGEGSSFQQRVRARMTSALEQCGGAWLPVIYPDAKPEHAIAATTAGARMVLLAGAEPILGAARRAPVSIAVGPEGGFEEEEIAAMVAAGFGAAGLAGNVLRFETAGVAALAIVRAALALAAESTNAR